MPNSFVNSKLKEYNL